MFYLFIAILLISAANILSAAASRRANTNMVTLVVQTFSVVLPLLIIAPAIAKRSIAIHKTEIVMAIAAGLLLGLFAMAVNKSFTVSKVGIVIPVIYGGTILLSAVLSYFVFKETLKGFELAGLFLVLAGLGFMIYARGVS